MQLIVNYVMCILLVGGIFTFIVSIMAFVNVEALRINKNKHIESGINLLITSFVFCGLFVFSYYMSRLKKKSDNQSNRKVSIIRKSIFSINQHNNNEKDFNKPLVEESDMRKGYSSEMKEIVEQKKSIDSKNSNSKSSKHMDVIESYLQQDQSNLSIEDDYIENKNFGDIL